MDNITLLKIDNMSYLGNVSINIFDGKNLVKNIAGHNAGGPGIFKFFAECVAGNFSESLCPGKIKLFYYPGNLGAAQTGEANGVLFDNETGMQKRSNMIGYSISPTTEVITHPKPSLEGKKAILHFTIPYSFIDTSSGNEINTIALYNKGVSEDDNSLYSAVFFITKTEGTTTSFDPITINSNDNYSLVVDWELQITK